MSGREVALKRHRRTRRYARHPPPGIRRRRLAGLALLRSEAPEGIPPARRENLSDLPRRRWRALRVRRSLLPRIAVLRQLSTTGAGLVDAAARLFGLSEAVARWLRTPGQSTRPRAIDGALVFALPLPPADADGVANDTQAITVAITERRARSPAFRCSRRGDRRGLGALPWTTGRRFVGHGSDPHGQRDRRVDPAVPPYPLALTRGRPRPDEQGSACTSTAVAAYCMYAIDHRT
jgi:hypothetical protein